MACENAGSRITLTLPNGIKLTYGFDNANELTGLTYTLGASTLGNLSYQYDNDGRIINRGGTLDVTNLPAALASASYDANNRLTNWGGQALSYDADGNLTGDGTNTYTWDTRNQLTGITGGATASFLYDGLNLEQELNGTTPTVNYLTGAGIDETLSRTDSSGTASYLTDNLGSTLALTNSSGAISTSYSYEPYGNTTQSGSSSTNALQYTGRENDSDGLYYYRARYYSPVYGRFMSSDPIGLISGVNTYSYVRDNPNNFIDPFGLATFQIGLTIGGGAFGGGGVGFVGISFDTTGGVAAYYGGGGGFAVGSGFSGGVSFQASNAANNGDLAQWFQNGSLGGGWGPDATGDEFVGSSPDGTVLGGGITLGAGLGATAFDGMTYTHVTPLFNFHNLFKWFHPNGPCS